MTGPARVEDAFRAAGLDFEISQFDHRLIAQKFVYLLEELDVPLGYRGTYSFYLRGTYSPTLTRDLFRDAESKKPHRDAGLTDEERKTIRRLAETTKLRPHILEVMAAYRYLRRHEKSQDEAVRMIRTHKPFISPRDLAIGVSKCKSLWPEISQADADSLREEMRPWDEANAEDSL